MTFERASVSGGVDATSPGALKRLCRYVLRPPLARTRLALTPDGRVALTLKRTYADGTTEKVFTAVEMSGSRGSPRRHLVTRRSTTASSRPNRSFSLASSPSVRDGDGRGASS